MNTLLLIAALTFGTVQTKVQDNTVFNSTKDTAYGTVCVDDSLDGIPFNYCYQNQNGLDPTKVLWWLHYAGGDARHFFDSASYTAMKGHWRNEFKTPPMTIGVSFGQYWTLDDNHNQWVAGNVNLQSFFVQRVMPYLEHKIGVASNPTRWGVGFSMGGYNLANVMHTYPGLFQKGIFGAAAFMNLNPWSGAAAETAYIARNLHCQQSKVDFWLWLAGRDEPTVTDWRRNDPLTFTLSSPVYVWANDLDEYGFEEGAAIFAAHNNTTSVIVPGTHMTDDSVVTLGMADFLQ